MSVSPFKIDIAKEEVERLRRKLQDTRIPLDPIVPEARRDYGPSIEWFHRLYNKWLHDFDWSSAQARLNRHQHYLADVEDEGRKVQVHFTHTTSSRPDAIPLILVHGWPGSFHEFDLVVDQLANPEQSTEPAFHVVVPSLPGFCWSSNPPRRGWTMQDTARLLNTLMVHQLGYSSYAVQAGDWGSFVAREMGSKFPECKAVHLNFCPVPLSPQEDANLTPREEKVMERYHDWHDNHLGYAVTMRSRPHTIGFALADNPVGILAWVGEKYEEAVFPDRLNDPEWDREILITASLYFFSGCIMTSMLPYYENVKHADFGDYFLRKENYIGVPFGYTSYLYDTRPGTQRSVKATGRSVYYNECDDGGHFAALEKPDVFLADCRKFFGTWYKA